MVFGLEILLGSVRKLHPLDFGEGIDDDGNIVAKTDLYVFNSFVGIFDHIMQKAGRDRVRPTLELAENIGHFNRVLNIRLTRFSKNSGVLSRGKIVGIVDKLAVGGVGDVGAIKIPHILISMHRIATIREKGFRLRRGLHARGCRLNFAWFVFRHVVVIIYYETRKSPRFMVEDEGPLDNV